MTKLLLSILVLFALLAILYFLFSKQIGDKFLINDNNVPVPAEVTLNPTPTLKPTPTTSPEDDLTALDKDLSSLQTSDTNLGQDLNTL